MDLKLQEAYQVMQKASGIKPGDRVRVLRKARDYEMGWPCVWEGSTDYYVGDEMIVDKVISMGVCLKATGFVFPFFVLEIIESAKEIETRYFCDGKDITDDLSEDTKKRLRK